MDKSDFEHIMKCSASTNFLRGIIHNGILDLHRVEYINIHGCVIKSENPLWIALSARNVSLMPVPISMKNCLTSRKPRLIYERRRRGMVMINTTSCCGVLTSGSWSIMAVLGLRA